MRDPGLFDQSGVATDLPRNEPMHDQLRSVAYNSLIDFDCHGKIQYSALLARRKRAICAIMICSAPVSRGGHNPGSNPMMGFIAPWNERRDAIVADFTICKPRESRRTRKGFPSGNSAQLIKPTNSCCLL